MQGITFSFLPADIVSQILNFGLPSPIDIQIIGPKFAENRQYLAILFEKIRHVPGIVDAHVQQAFDQPELDVNVDRSRASQLGLTQRDVATNMLITLSGSFQTAPTFYLNPKNGVSYNIVTQTPQYQLNSLDALKNIPITNGTNNSRQTILQNLSTVSRSAGPAVLSHYNAQPALDIYASIQGRDLGGVSSDINKIIKETAKDLPKGSTVVGRGPDADPYRIIPWSLRGFGICDCSGLFAHRSEFPVMA